MDNNQVAAHVDGYSVDYEAGGDTFEPALTPNSNGRVWLYLFHVKHGTIRRVAASQHVTTM